MAKMAGIFSPKHQIRMGMAKLMIPSMSFCLPVGSIRTAETMFGPLFMKLPIITALQCSAISKTFIDNATFFTTPLLRATPPQNEEGMEIVPSCCKGGGRRSRRGAWSTARGFVKAVLSTQPVEKYKSCSRRLFKVLRHRSFTSSWSAKGLYSCPRLDAPYRPCSPR